MEFLIEKIQYHPLFYGIKKEDISPILSCLQSYIRSYKKEEIIILSQNTVKSIGLVLTVY